MPESRLLDFSRQGHPGAFALIGVKFTTARASAERALQRMGLGGRSSQPSLEITVPPVRLPHGDADGALSAIEAVSVECDVQIDDEASAHLVDWYATEAAEVVRVGAAVGRVRRLVPGLPVLDAEIVYAVERSRAHHLADAVLRRTRLGGNGHPGREALDAAADVMTERLGWSADTRAAEIALVEERYRI